MNFKVFTGVVSATIEVQYLTAPSNVINSTGKGMEHRNAKSKLN